MQRQSVTFHPGAAASLQTTNTTNNTHTTDTTNTTAPAQNSPGLSTGDYQHLQSLAHFILPTVSSTSLFHCFGDCLLLNMSPLRLWSLSKVDGSPIRCLKYIVAFHHRLGSLGPARSISFADTCSTLLSCPSHYSALCINSFDVAHCRCQTGFALFLG